EDSIPALRSMFPGLNKYSDDFHSVSSYKQKTGWHTLKFTVSANTIIPTKNIATRTNTPPNTTT
ncbi:hypothetical protein ACSLO8_30820, partial [Escherichia coli]